MKLRSNCLLSVCVLSMVARFEEEGLLSAKLRGSSSQLVRSLAVPVQILRWKRSTGPLCSTQTAGQLHNISSVSVSKGETHVLTWIQRSEPQKRLDERIPGRERQVKMPMLGTAWIASRSLVLEISDRLTSEHSGLFLCLDLFYG